MSRALKIVTAILTILHCYVSAQAPTCIPGFNALFNSLGQSPCTMAVALGGACVDGAFSLDPLPPGFVYLGPTQAQANPCRCSTVFYSVLSACAVCQLESFLNWSNYDMNCTNVFIETYNETIPSTIVVPHYAYLDVVTGDSFNVTAAESAGGPESSPLPSATSSTSTSATSTPATVTGTTFISFGGPEPSPFVTSTSTPITVIATSKKSNLGAIIGGAVGGVAFLGIVVGLIAFIFLRRRRRSAATPSTYYSAVTSPDINGDMKYNNSINSPGRLYNPNDPSTFPSNPVSYSTYSGSPLPVLGSVPTHYAGTPEL